MASLSEVIQLIQSQQATRDALRERKVERAHEIEKLHIANTLNDLNYQRERRDNLLDRITELGIIENDLSSVDDANTTPGSTEIMKEKEISITNELDNTRSQILDLSNTLKSYHTGLNLGKNIDLDKSGEVTTDELTDWFEGTGTDPKYLDDTAFLSGIRAYERTPEALIELERATTASDIEKAKLKYLPKSLKQDQELKDTLDKSITHEVIGDWGRGEMLRMGRKDYWSHPEAKGLEDKK